MFRKIVAKLVIIRDTFLARIKYVTLRVRCEIGKSTKARPAERHLLILAWLFPPKVSGGVYRPLSFARYAVEHGWSVTVIAGPEPDETTAAGQYLLDQLPTEVRVVRINQSTPSLSYRFIPRLDGKFIHVIYTLETALALDDLEPSIILASGPPFHNFVVGWHLSRYFQAPLVLDYRDEWTQCPFDFVDAGEFDIGWERRCLHRASSIIVTTQSFAEHAIRSFPEFDASKCKLIPNGFDPADLPAFTTKNGKAADDAPIDIVFMGSLASHTPPCGFISTLHEVLLTRPDWEGRLRLKFVGTRSADMPLKIQQSGLGHLIQLIDQVPKPEAIRIMRESAVLLILNPSALRRYIPGKLFDYVAAGTPILVYGEGGEAARIVSELNVGEIVPENDPRALAAAIEQIVSTDQMPDKTEREAWLALHHRGRLAKQLIDHLDRIVING